MCFGFNMAMFYLQGNRLRCSGEARPTRVVMFAITLCFVMISHENVEPALVHVPSNTAALVNESTYFNCSTSMRPMDERTIIWFHYPLGAEGDRKYVFDEGRIMTDYRNRFTIDIDFSLGSANLVGLRLEQKDAGRYECSDNIHFGQGASAELIILESNLLCESDVDPNGIVGPTPCGRTIATDEVQLTCSVRYIGNNSPQLEWRKSGDFSTSTLTECVTKDNRVECNTALTANKQENTAAYVCESTTQPRYTCSLAIRSLPYVFSGGKTLTVTMDENIICSANSSQSCSYKWKWFNGNESLTVSTNHTMKPTRAGSHRCEATCSVGNRSCTVNVMTVEVYPTTSPEGTARSKWFFLFFLLPMTGTIIATIVLYKRAGRKPVTSKPALKTDEPLVKITMEDENQRNRKYTTPIERSRDFTELGIETDESISPLITLAADDKDLVNQCHTKNTDRLKVYDSIRCPQSAPVWSQEQGLKRFDKKDRYMHVATITLDDKERRITAVAILNNKLFVASKKSLNIEVFDTIDKFKFKHRVPVAEMLNPFDLACCGKTNCVFISDSKLESKAKEIIRIEKSLTVGKRWSTDDDFGNLSVSSESNIILCVSKNNVLIEYTRDGEKIRVITLHDIVHPRHAIRLLNGQFVISSGMKNDTQHRVCCVNENGKVLRSFGVEKGTSLQHLNEPNYMIVNEDEDGFILVVDIVATNECCC